MSSSSINKLLFFLLFTASCFGQSPTLGGRVLDSAGHPVPYADALLLHAQDSTAYKATVTNEQGIFNFNDVLPNNYVLKVIAIGFKKSYQAIAVEGVVKLNDIVLKDDIQQLGEVVINGKKPVVTRKADRLEFNVEGSTLSSENAWEILRKTPGVSMAGDALSIRGSSGILVTINDKKVYLTGIELKNLLENTDGDNIKSVEVITTPPAKYEAQGSAVLNIKMKKAIAPGYKGSVAGAYVQGVYPKGVVSTNHFYTSKKLAVTGGLMFGSGNYYNLNNSEIRYFANDGSTASTWKSREESVFRAESQKTYNVTVEYRLDSLNTVTVGGNGFNNLNSAANIKTATYIYGAAGALDSLFVSNNHRSYPQKNSTFNGSFEHKFSDKDKLTFSGDYTNHYFSESQDIFSAFSLPGAAPHRDTRILTDDKRNIYLLSLQADYNAAKWGSNIEAGVRYGTVNADNGYIYADEGGVPDAGLSNKFLYDEKIFAGYISADREAGKWSFKAGLRGEYTSLKGNSVTMSLLNEQEYFKIFPTLYTLYKSDDKNQIGLSYGKRIIRPQYGDLNPFRSYSNPYSYLTGDPKLQPAIAHNLSLLYTFKDKYNLDLYYRYEKNPAMQVTYQDYETSTLVTKITNIKSNKSFGLDFNTNVEFFPWWTSAVQLTGAYGDNIFQGADGGLYNNDIFSFNGSTNNRFTLNKAKNLLAEVNFDYSSTRVFGALELGPVSSLMLSLRKKFLHDNAELTLIFLDVYKGEIQNITTRYANQYSYSSIYNESKNLRIQFRYRFGNQKLQDGKTREQTDEQRRL